MTPLASREMTEQEMINTSTAPQMAHLIQILRQTIRNKEKEIQKWVDMVNQLQRDDELDPPEPKPLLADARVGDLCKHRNGDWSQIIDTNGTYIPGQPIRTTLKDTKGINRNFCLSGCHFTMQFGGEYDIIHTEPLAEVGTAEWAWQMMLLGKDIIHENQPAFRRFDTFSSTEIRVSDAEGEVVEIVPYDRFLAFAAKTGWQLYEEPAKESEPEFKVGGWVEIEVSGVISQQLVKLGVFADSVNAGGIEFYGNGLPVMKPMNARIIRKLDPSEVKVMLTLEGTVSKDYNEKLDSFILNHADGHTRNRIKYSTIDTETAALVEALLAAQEEK